jgi:two-component system response regulator NreC
MRESPITESEIKVLRAYARGLTTREIAQKFFVSIKTIEAQRASLLRKLEMRTVPEAVVWAVQVGMITKC